MSEAREHRLITNQREKGAVALGIAGALALTSGCGTSEAGNYQGFKIVTDCPRSAPDISVNRITNPHNGDDSMVTLSCSKGNAAPVSPSGIEVILPDGRQRARGARSSSTVTQTLNLRGYFAEGVWPNEHIGPPVIKLHAGRHRRHATVTLNYVGQVRTS